MTGHWIKLLIAAIVTGAANTGLSALGIATANGIGANVPQLDLKQLGIMLLTGGIVGALAYLKQSPVPEDSSQDQPISAPVSASNKSAETPTVSANGTKAE